MYYIIGMQYINPHTHMRALGGIQSVAGSHMKLFEPMHALEELLKQEQRRGSWAPTTLSPPTWGSHLGLPA